MGTLRSLTGIVLMVASLVIAPLASHPLHATSTHGDHPVLANGIIVRLNPELGDVLQLVLDLIETLVPASEIVVLDSFDGRYWIQIPAGPLVDEVLYLLTGPLAGNLLAYASPNYVNTHPERDNFQSFAWGGQADCSYSGDEAWRDQPAWQTMGFDDIHDYATGAGTVVAVIDSGVWHDHPVLQGRIHPASTDLLDDGQAAGAALAHGTHVAGIVALAAPQSTILDLRVLDAAGMGHDFHTAKAVWMAVNAGAQVINLSLGSRAGQPPILADVFEHAAAHNVLIAGAAGNLGPDSHLQPGDRQYPAAEQCALAIAAVDDELLVADFSNIGDWISFSAPGAHIYSTLHEQPDGSPWGCWSGTSMATPFVSATAALMKQVSPSLSAPEAAAYLAHTALPDPDGQTGYGMIQPTAAVASAAAHQAVPVFSPLNICAAYHVAPPAQLPDSPAPGPDDASLHQASGLELSATIGLLGGSGDVLNIGPLPILQTSGSLPFQHHESMMELDAQSVLGLISLAAGPLALDAAFEGATGPSTTTSAVAELALEVRLLDLLGLGDLLEIALSADTVQSVASVSGACGDLTPQGATQIANGMLSASLLGAINLPVPIDAAPAPNTGIDLDVLGLAGATLYLNEQVVSGDGQMESSIEVNALRLSINLDIELIVPVASVQLELIAGQSRASRNCKNADVDILLTATPSPGVEAGALAYTATAFNAGPERARGVRAVFTRPDSTEFVVADAPADCAWTRFNEMTCALGDIEPETSAHAIIAVTTPLPGEILSGVRVDSAELDPDDSNNAMELLTVILGLDVFNRIFSDRFENP